ncbi:MAG: ATP-binding protein [Lachnospiraceae bacterium]|nr:ATP-binding protein [Lachnospiraceae bacterium]
MNQNPYNLTFGKTPTQMITRITQESEITRAFLAATPSIQVYMVTGVRGCGKTVFMTSVANAIARDDKWIVVELNSSGELLKELAAKLYNTKGLSKLFDSAGINLSFWGIGVNIKKAEPITDLATAVERMLEHLKKREKRVLITIDEVTNTKEMRYFAGEFQIMLRHDLPVYLLMTGLYENINKLQNEDNLTFLYRAPRIHLGALNVGRISDSYEKNLGLSKEDALALAKKSKGYSYAFQVIGYFSYIKNGDYEAALPDIRQYLSEFVYEKLWMEVSGREKEILTSMVTNHSNKISMLKEKLSMKPNEFSVYRDRLIKKGILDGSIRGLLSFTLPYFDEFVNEHADL